MRRHLVLVVAVAVVSGAFAVGTAAEQVPDLSGTWIWKSRPIDRPMRIRQTPDELIVEAVGLPQGAVDEAFWLNGTEREETYPGPGFVRRYRTTGRWEGRTWVATIKAFAGWSGSTVAREANTVVTRTFALDSSGTRLTVVSRGAGPPPGRGPGDYVYEFEKAR